MASILVIDDELGLRLLLMKALQRAGHEVLTASNGNEGIALEHE